MRLFKTLTIAAMLAAGSMTGAMAQTLSETNSAYASATKEGTSANSISVESNTAPGDVGFGEFGVFDFAGTSASTSPITSFTLTMTTYSGKYGVSGPLDFFLSGNTTPLTGTGSEGLLYQVGAAGADGPNDGIGTQLGTLTSLGTQTYTTQPYTAGGTTVSGPASFTFILSAAAQTALSNDLKAGDVKLVMGAPAGGTVGTEIDGAKYTGAGYSAPTLALNAGVPAVPEASTTASFGLLLALGLGGVAIARRRKRA